MVMTTEGRDASVTHLSDRALYRRSEEMLFEAAGMPVPRIRFDGLLSNLFPFQDWFSIAGYTVAQIKIDQILV